MKEFEDEIEFNENQISKYKSELSNYRSRIEHENAIYAEVGFQNTFWLDDSRLYIGPLIGWNNF